jgi:hypothetical protein
MSALQYGILRPIPHAAPAMRPSQAAQSFRKRRGGELTDLQSWARAWKKT